MSPEQPAPQVGNLDIDTPRKRSHYLPQDCTVISEPSSHEYIVIKQVGLFHNQSIHLIYKVLLQRSGLYLIHRIVDEPTAVITYNNIRYRRR